MKLEIVLGATALIFLAGCKPPADSTTKRSSEIGRFQFHAGSGDMPPILLDTVTGCIESFVRLEDTTNPKVIYWARKYEGAPLAEPMDDGGTFGPPMRCPSYKSAKDK